MSYVTYKVIHYLGIFLLVVALGAALGRKVTSEGPDPLRRRFVALHGVGLFLVLLGGFGLLARTGVSHGALFPGWVWAKLAIWVVLGGTVMLARRRAAWAMPLLLVVPALAALAGVLAFLKPF
ncbi:MAG: hypothetical protein EA351_03160 [Gemmatimonadales bacterium]|nr:MAG: hypothetical protein EA351_03160 [Gemmatimonadales bacterium]